MRERAEHYIVSGTWTCPKKKQGKNGSGESVDTGSASLFHDFRSTSIPHKLRGEAEVEHERSGVVRYTPMPNLSMHASESMIGQCAWLTCECVSLG